VIAGDIVGLVESDGHRRRHITNEVASERPERYEENGTMCGNGLIMLVLAARRTVTATP
jgi:hypothetical protein